MIQEKAKATKDEGRSEEKKDKRRSETGQGQEEKEKRGGERKEGKEIIRKDRKRSKSKVKGVSEMKDVMKG